MTTLLVDGPNILMRSVKAMGSSGLSAEGHATGPLHAFIRSMGAAVVAHQPARVIVCWDESPSRYRSAIFPSYKAHRASGGDEVAYSAFDLARTFLSLAGVPHVRLQGYEADDLIAAHVQVAETPVVILSGDKDLLQLVAPGVQVDRPGDAGLWDVGRVRSDFGCSPKHVALVLALAGDDSDGIPGVERVGRPTALKDLAAVGWSLDRLLDEGHERYREAAAIIRRNLLLVDLHGGVLTGIEVDPPSEFSPTKEGDVLWPMLLEFLDRYKLATVWSQLQSGALWGRA